MGAYKPSNKASPLKVIDTAKASQCPSGDTSVTWNQGFAVRNDPRTPSRRSGRLRWTEGPTAIEESCPTGKGRNKW